MAALAVVVVMWDWTWLRPSIQRYVHERSARRVDFDAMHVGLDGPGALVVSFRGLRIENAAWAERRPLIVAGKASFSFVWRSLFEDVIVVQRIRLVDTQVDLERQADGLRNWRLTRPEDRGPMRVKVLSLDAQDSSVRFLHRGMDLDVTARASSLAAPEVLPGLPEVLLSNSIEFDGALRGTAFDGRVAASRLLTFFDTRQPFGVRGHAHVAGVDVAAEGRVADLVTLDSVELDVRASAKAGAALWRHLPAGLAAPPSGVVASARVAKSGPRWTLANLRATSGGSDLAGRIEIDRPAQANRRPLVRAQLTSARLNFGDFQRPTSPPDTAVSAGAKRATPLPGAPLDLTALRSVDAEFGLRVGELAVAGGVGPLRETRLDASLAGGVLTLQRFETQVAGGHVKAAGRLDAIGAEPVILLDASASDLQLDQVVTSLAQPRQVTGELDAQIRWTAQGGSWHALTRRGTGTVAVALRNASIPPALDAKLALDAGAVVAAWFRSDGRVPVRCGELKVDFVGGKGTTRQMSLATERVTIAGRGSVDLSAQTFDLVLTPYRHHATPLALRQSMQVAGTFDSARVALVDLDEPNLATTCGRPPGSRSSGPGGLERQRLPRKGSSKSRNLVVSGTPALP